MPKEVLVGKKALCEIVQETKQKQHDATQAKNAAASASHDAASATMPIKSQFNIIGFKESLRQRLKEKRVQQRKEEEEEAQMDEEYHCVKKSDVLNDDENSRLSSSTVPPADSNSENKDSSESSNEESEEKTSDEEQDQDVNDSDSGDDHEFKLGMEDDEEEEDESDKEEEAASKKKKKQLSGGGTRKVIESDEDTESEDDDSYASSKSKAKSINGDIPPTIPSNQLTNSKLKPTTLDEAIYASQLNEINKRRSLDELTNISFNCDALNTTINSTKDPNNANNPNDTSQNLTDHDTTVNNDEEGLFDELAFLCSGQFKSGNTQKKTQTSATSEIKKDSSMIAINDNDLYAVDDEEEEANNDKKTKPTVLEEIEDEATTSSILSSAKSSEKQEIESLDEENSPPKKEKRKIREEEEDDEELDTDKEEEEIDEDTGSNDKEYFEKKLRKEGFLEDEAELSGSEAESDEDYDGDPEEDEKGLLFSGDEADLPSDNELKDELGKIYLKDQRDKDLREMRELKERFLTDGEFHSKNSRKKQFRWKNLDNLKTNYSSDEDKDEDEEEEGEVEKAETDENAEKAKSKKKTFKPIGDWRSNRHEREKFVLDKMKSTATLLSDEEDSNSNSQNEEFSLKTGNQLLKKGQELIRKQSVVGKTQSTKRPSSFLSEDTSSYKSTAALFGNMTVSKSSTIAVNQKEPGKDEVSQNAKKYSFLNGDKSYLSRLSNYVNKNCHTGGVGVKTAVGRNSNMVFMSRNQNENQSDEENDTNLVNDTNKSSFSTRSKNTFAKPTTSNTSSVPEPKRPKFDQEKSIFNHF